MKVPHFRIPRWLSASEVPTRRLGSAVLFKSAYPQTPKDGDERFFFIDDTGHLQDMDRTDGVLHLPPGLCVRRRRRRGAGLLRLPVQDHREHVPLRRLVHGRSVPVPHHGELVPLRRLLHDLRLVS